MYKFGQFFNSFLPLLAEIYTFPRKNILPILWVPVNFQVIQTVKEKDLKAGLGDAIQSAINHKHPILFSCSFRFDVRDLLPLLTHPADKNQIRIYWEQPSRGAAFAGIGSVVDISKKRECNPELVKEELLHTIQTGVALSDNSLIGPRFMGGFAFNQSERPDETWKDFPHTRFLIPQCLATLTDDGAWLTISVMVNKEDTTKNLSEEIKKTISFYQNRLPVTLPPISRVAVDKFKDVPDENTYNQTIYTALEKIKPGYLEKVVISRSHHVKIGRDFSAVSAMQILRNAYSKCNSFFFSFPGQGTFFGSTPERLIHLRNGYAKTEALAGTIARGKNMEEDRVLAETLLDSHKEREEHNLVREQILRKLKGLVRDIQYPEIPQILKLKNVQHLQTPIAGQLTGSETVLDLVSILHPTSAVAGSPTYTAMDLIGKLESHDRGWYSGPIGWIDAKGEGEFFVALRSALVKDEEAHVFAGGGIVSESLPETEWNETELKLQPIISALSGGQI